MGDHSGAAIGSGSNRDAGPITINEGVVYATARNGGAGIGGDEFVAFRTDAKMDAVTAEIDQLRRELAEKGYHVSFGVAEQDKAQGGLDMHGLVMEADRRMLGAKQEFYCKPENNRRNRQADRRS